MRVSLRFSLGSWAVGALKGHVDTKYVRIHHLSFYLPFFFLSIFWHEFRP